jgi:epoxyqueuosine reductase
MCWRAAPAHRFDDVRYVLEARRAAGLAGTMQFTYRNPARSTDPERTLPGARRLVVGPCRTSATRRSPEGQGPVARVARYVWGDDHERLLARPGRRARRARGRRSPGLRGGRPEPPGRSGGRSSSRARLVRQERQPVAPGRGSWFVLGSVLTDAALPMRPNPHRWPTGAAPASDACRPAPPAPSWRRGGRRSSMPLVAAPDPGLVPARASGGTRRPDLRLRRLPGRVPAEPARRSAGGRRRQPVALGRPERAWVAVLDLLVATDAELLGTPRRLVHRRSETLATCGATRW